MIHFHPAYARAREIHQRILDRMTSLIIPESLTDEALEAPYRWIDVITTATAVYLSRREMSEENINRQINGITQNQVDNALLSKSKTSGREFFGLLTLAPIIAELLPYNGVVKLRGHDYLIDCFDCTLKPAQFDDLISLDTIEYHAHRLQTQLSARNIGKIPSLADIHEELARVSGIDLGFYARRIPAHLTLFDKIMPSEVYYTPNGIINNMPKFDHIQDHLTMLRQVSKLIIVDPANGKMPKSYALRSYLVGKELAKSRISINIILALQYDNFTNLLEPTIEVRRAHGYIYTTEEEGKKYNLGDAATISELAQMLADAVNQNIANDQKLVEATFKRRQTKLEGQSKIQIDQVSQTMLDMIDRLDPDKGHKLRSGKIKNYLMKVSDGGDFFAGHSLVKNGKVNRTRISFRAKDGEFHVRMGLSEKHLWENDRLEIRPALPEVIVASLKGKSAGEVIDHPISAMLGNIRQASNKNGRTEIRFNKRVNEIS